MKVKLTWLLWLIVSIGIGGYFGYILLASEDKSEFLIGETTYGHYQIEMSCSSCHSEAFGGPEVLQNACMNCHAEELEQAQDSHPKKKFTDPREAYRLEIIDARYCVSCHTEHQKEQTHEMGLTLPKDYCFHCHTEVGEERESHKDLPFDSCASSGCHNYHDNRALYENFLVKHANEPWLDDIASIATANHAVRTAPDTNKQSATALQQIAQHPDIIAQWNQQNHSHANVSCASCHSDDQENWIEKPNEQQCQSCHQQETNGFLAGKHGMRLATNIESTLAPLSPKQSPLAFKESAMDARHGCNSCHSAHSFNTQTAATSACLDCHNDDHSLAFLDSPHGKLWQMAEKQQIPEENAVSCATCHMHRVVETRVGTKLDSKVAGESAKTATQNQAQDLQNAPLVRVEHNQNMTLRPNEKMIRPVCMQCHSLEFSIDALADKLLIDNNFNGQPSTHIPSIDWSLKREQR